MLRIRAFGVEHNRHGKPAESVLADYAVPYVVLSVNANQIVIRRNCRVLGGRLTERLVAVEYACDLVPATHDAHLPRPFRAFMFLRRQLELAKHKSGAIDAL